MGRQSQRKGREGERELRDKLREYGYDVNCGDPLSFGTVPDLVGLPGIHVEVKRVERLNVPEAMQQAVRDSEKFQDGMPALFHRRNRQPWLVTIRLEDFMRLYRSQSLSTLCATEHEALPACRFTSKEENRVTGPETAQDARI